MDIYSSYRNKRRVLLCIIAVLLCLLFCRGIELHLIKHMTNRIKFHALPVAISVLYHQHPHDYTAIREVALPFQGPEKAGKLIQTAIKQPIVNPNENYYWFADDKGFADYIIAAFYIFGPHVMSMYAMWFLILLGTTLLYIYSFGRSLSKLAFLCLIFLGVHVAISTLPLSGRQIASVFPMEAATIYEPRFFDVLAIISIFHMIFIAIRNNPFKWFKDGWPLVMQILLFMFLYHARSSLAWEIMAILAICSTTLIYRLYKNYQNRNRTSCRYRYQSAMITAGMMIILMAALNIYKHQVYNPGYFSDMGARTIWHNALMGFSYGYYHDPYLEKKYGLTGVNDLNVAQVVIKFARANGVCPHDIEKLEAQQLLNTLGNWGNANWQNYEQCAKLLFYSIASENKLRMLYMYVLRNPMNALHTLYISMTNSTWHVWLLGEGWNPLSILNLSFYFLILWTSWTALCRVSKKLLISTSALFIFSFIPSIAFYSVILTMGGLFVSAAIMCYLVIQIILYQCAYWMRHYKIGILNAAGSEL